MIDIKKELESIQDDFNSKYITLYDIVEFLKNESDASYSEVAQYLLLKLLPYEPIPDRRFELDTGLDAYTYYQFKNADYLMPYRTPSKLYYTDKQIVYFEEVKDALKMLDAFDRIPKLNDAIASIHHKSVKYKNKVYHANPFGEPAYEDISFNIDDIKRVTGLDFSTYKKDGVVNKLSQEEINDYIENDNTIESIDELNITLEQNSYTELEQQNKTQANRIAELEQQLEELKQKLAQATQPLTVDEKQSRISQPQRDIFTLLVINNFQNYQSRHALFEAINADMKEKGIRASTIKYPTLDNLIDDNLRIKNSSPFPPKQK